MMYFFGLSAVFAPLLHFITNPVNGIVCPAPAISLYRGWWVASFPGGGRVPALEVMIGTSPIQNLIREAKIFQIPSVMQTSRKQGMCLMNDSLLELVKKRVVEPGEAVAKAVDKAGMRSMFEASGIAL
jgi:hypothetical protein